MNRRKFLVSLSSLLGVSVLSLDTLMIDSALAFTGKDASKLSNKEQQLIATIADIIIPQTETPSATQAGVLPYIDFYLHEFLSESKRTLFLQGLHTEFVENSQLLQLTPNQQIAIIQSLDDTLLTANENVIYKQLKHLVVIGYYTSEIGATQALKYDPVPGPYKEMKLKEVGRVWA